MADYLIKLLSLLNENSPRSSKNSGVTLANSKILDVIF